MGTILVKPTSLKKKIQHFINYYINNKYVHMKNNKNLFCIMKLKKKLYYYKYIWYISETCMGTWLLQ